ncbi:MULTISPECIES: hypothetical protein [unclassified Leptolyngbya]|uniref:DUF6962 family protein n=1 Tax=unclassified Leptolyngbya TaxID=2650499 RepID=UPI0016823D24|nr:MULTISPECIES: hypothetical protein [unclassified Leptolyngbya]MBD1909008.1 hypothetical protein [Leptolyngbya sp. FACHB-8]MBD2158092.1 hypothetical protein [Leptolyngbya sp. FACHB-16]
MIANPAIALTDYVIVLEAAFFALRLVWLGRVGQLWAAAFVSTGLAAAFGGTVHGFVDTLSLRMQVLLWQGVVASLGIAGCLMIIATAWETLKGPMRYWLMAIAVCKASISLSFAIAHLSFAWSVVDYLVSMIIVLMLRQRATMVSWASTMIWTVLGVGLSAAAILALLFSKSETNWLQPEVQYHVIQMVALYSFFRAACVSQHSRY